MNNTKTTLNKKVSVLAGAVLAASSSQAAFDQGNAVLFAYNGSNDNTYFVDLGVSGQDLFNATKVNFNDAGLAAFLNSNFDVQWTVIASINDSTAVGGPPAAGQSLANSGVVSSSATGSAVGVSGQDALIQRDIMNDWLADVQAASGGSASFGVTGADPVSADAARNGGFFNDSLISLGFYDGPFGEEWLGGQSNLFYSQANPAEGTTLADNLLISQLPGNYIFRLSYDGYFEGIEGSAVPIPAAAWLFGSALAGLGLARRKK